MAAHQEHLPHLQSRSIVHGEKGFTPGGSMIWGSIRNIPPLVLFLIYLNKSYSAIYFIWTYGELTEQSNLSITLFVGSMSVYETCTDFCIRLIPCVTVNISLCIHYVHFWIVEHKAVQLENWLVCLRCILALVDVDLFVELEKSIVLFFHFYKYIGTWWLVKVNVCFLYSV